MKAGEFWIERHTIVTSNIKVGRARDTPMKPCTYRVLAVFDKLANKWFMTGEKKAWSRSTKEEDKKRYKVRMRMVTDGALEKYDDVALHDDSFRQNQIYRVVTGAEIVDVLGKYIPSSL